MAKATLKKEKLTLSFDPTLTENTLRLTQYAILFVMSLFLIEASLTIANYLSVSVRRVLAPPWDVAEPTLPDEKLVYRGNPLHPGHDDWGYRNHIRPRTVDIVTLGDSQTYGTGVEDGSWPSQLSALTYASVYNMALPGYGPAHSLLQFEQALLLKPNTIILAVYFGNDFYDSFALAQRNADLASAVSPEVRIAAEGLEKRTSLASEISKLHPALKEVEARQKPNAARRWLSAHLKTYGLLRALKSRLTRRTEYSLFSKNFKAIVEVLVPAQRQYYFPFQDAEWQTILTPPYRAAAVNDDDPRIRLGFKVSLSAIDSVVDQCRGKGIQHLVVLIPTKGSVFWSRMSEPEAPPALHELVRNEERLKNELIAHLRGRGVPYVDLLEPLQRAPIQPYFEDADSHPNTIGHRIIAVQIAKRIGNRKVLGKQRSLPENAPFPKHGRRR